MLSLYFRQVLIGLVLNSICSRTQVAELPSLMGSPAPSAGAMVTLRLGAEVEGDWWAAGRPLPQARTKKPKPASSGQRSRSASAAASKNPLTTGKTSSKDTQAAGGVDDDDDDDEEVMINGKKVDSFEADDFSRKKDDVRNGVDPNAPFRHAVEDEVSIFAKQLGC